LCRRSRNSASASCPSAARQGFSPRDHESTTFDRPIPQRRAALLAEARKANQGLVDLLGKSQAAEGDLGPDRDCLAVGPKAMDRADPRHYQAASPLRKIVARANVN